MKKLLLAGAFALFGAVSMNAQSGFNLGANVGLPVGDAGDGYSFKLGLDANYLWSVGDGFNLGIGSGYQAWLGKEQTYNIMGTSVTVKNETLSMIPVVAVGEYNISDNFGIGADLGYAFMFANGNSDGGFMYQPKVMYNLGESGSLWLGYQGVSVDGWNASAINLGYRFHLGGN